MAGQLCAPLFAGAIVIKKEASSGEAATEGLSYIDFSNHARTGK